MIIKNLSRNSINTTFRGKRITLKGKNSLSLNGEDEEELALYHHLTQTFGFVIDITRNVNKYKLKNEK